MTPARHLALVLPLLACAPIGTAATRSIDDKPATTAPATSTFDQSHATWTEVLATHVKNDGFDYKALKKDRSKLDRYLASLEAVKPDEFAKWKRDEQYAFWIDAYNAYTVSRVVDGYPVASIKDLGDDKVSVWDREFIPLGSLAPDLKKSKLTLNDVENKILRPVFKDARVHAAINCASVGCPPLRDAAFTADKLSDQLDAQVKRWLGDANRNRFLSDKNTVEISQVFDWFKDDFVRDEKSVVNWLAKHSPENAEWLRGAKSPTIRYLDYSWKLNEAR
jgi:hypothetical protein